MQPVVWPISAALDSEKLLLRDAMTDLSVFPHTAHTSNTSKQPRRPWHSGGTDEQTDGQTDGQTPVK